MKRGIVYVLLSGCFCLIGLSSLAQSEPKRVSYTYDAAGNRLTQTPIEIKLSSKSTKNGKSDTAIIATELVSRRIVVHPNPTKGALAIEIQNEDEEIEVTLQLYDLPGRLLMTQREKRLYIPLDMSARKKGVYLLRLTIGKETLEYKIIKE